MTETDPVAEFHERLRRALDPIRDARLRLPPSWAGLDKSLWAKARRAVEPAPEPGRIRGGGRPRFGIACRLVAEQRRRIDLVISELPDGLARSAEAALLRTVLADLGLERVDKFDEEVQAMLPALDARRLPEPSNPALTLIHTADSAAPGRLPAGGSHSVEHDVVCGDGGLRPVGRTCGSGTSWLNSRRRSGW